MYFNNLYQIRFFDIIQNEFVTINHLFSEEKGDQLVKQLEYCPDISFISMSTASNNDNE